MKHQKHSASGLWYMIGGAAMGTLLGALFAPRKGSELREDIGEWGRKGSEKGQSLMSALSGMVPSKAEAAKALEAVRVGGGEAIQEAKERLHLDGKNR